MKEDEANPDVLCLNIGRLKTKTEAVVKVKIITLLWAANDQYYQFQFPIDYIPKYKAAGSVKKKGYYLNGQFGMDIKITATDKIEVIKSKQKFKVERFTEDKKTYELKIPMQKDFKAKDIFI